MGFGLWVVGFFFFVGFISAQYHINNDNTRNRTQWYFPTGGEQKQRCKVQKEVKVHSK